MNAENNRHNDGHSDLVFLYALSALPHDEISAVEQQISVCDECQRELDVVRSTISSFVFWPAEVLRPPVSLWDRLAKKIESETGVTIGAEFPKVVKPEWEEVAPGISCKLLATDAANDRVSMLVKLAPGTDYPPHCHAGVEELHLLHGELIVDDKKLYPGDYIHAEAGSIDHRVWSETGCACVLITSTKDAIL